MWKMHPGHRVSGRVLVSRGSGRAKGLAKLCCLLLLIGSVAGQGCGKRPAGEAGEDSLAVERDALGRLVSVREYPRRIVSTAPSNTGMLLSLGLRDKLVGVTSFCVSPEKVEGVAKIGGYTNPSVAKVISLRPDFVLAAKGNPRDVIRQLRWRGIKVFTLDTRTVAGVLADIRKVGALTGCGERARRLVGEMESEIRDIREKVRKVREQEKPRVLWVGQEEPLRTAGPGSLVDDLIRLAGGKNVAGEEKSRWPSFGMEKVVLRDPEALILSEDKYKSSPARVAGTIARFKRHAVWGKISAVRKGRVYFIAADVVGQPSPACVEGLKLLARRLHPDLFAERAERGAAHDAGKRSD